MSDIKNTNWATLRVPTPDSLGQVGSLIDNAAQVSGTLLKILVRLNSIFAALASDSLSTSAIALRLVIANLENVIKDLTKPHSMHALFVPPLKGKGLRETRDYIGGLTDQDPARTAAGVAWDDYLEGDYLVDGNRGLLEQIAKSTYDIYDVNRPQFSPNSHIAGVLIVLGVNHADLPGKAWKFAKRLDAINSVVLGDDSPRLEELPIPRGITTKVVVRPKADSQAFIVKGVGDSPIAVRITWAPRPIRAIREYFQIKGQVTINNVILYKSSEPLPTHDPIAIADFEVKRIPYHTLLPINAQIYDYDIEEGSKYYYALSYDMEISALEDPSARDTSTHEYVTNSFPVYITSYEDALQASNQGTPPNWEGVINPMQFWGDFSDVLALVQAHIDHFMSSTFSMKAELNLHIENIKQTINHNLYLARHLILQIQSIKNKLLALSAAGAHVMAFAGQGGTGGMVTAIARALRDTNERAPDYRHGSLISGIVLVGGAESAAGIAPLERFFELTFSSPETSPAKKALDAVGEAITETKQLFLNQQMEPTKELTLEENPGKLC